MTVTKQKKAAEDFAKEWKDRGDEKEDCQSFWTALLRDVFGVEKPEKYMKFEKPVQLGHQSYIDVYIPETRVLIEQKSMGKDLSKPGPQSDGPALTPIRQARRYVDMLPVSEQPRWIITCNFQEFWIYDEEDKNSAPYKIKLADLPKEYYHLQFLVEEHNERLQAELDLSVKAGELVGKLYDAFLKQYKQPVSKEDLHSLNVLCVRLVFCLYAENGGIFGSHTMFHDYLADYPTQQMRFALEELFKVLDQPEGQRNKHLKEDFPKRAAFPYVNGGLFSQEEKIEIPPFTEEIRTMLLDQCSAGFDWSGISPTIFGAVFESTLNPETRRSGGMHYTSVQNIHKVIDPLFLDDLKTEFNVIKRVDVEKTRQKKLKEFQQKLSSLMFLDPACGSGNFLTETYISIRRLENDVVNELTNGQVMFGDDDFTPIMVSLNQFYGIEINDFAVTVARTALWIAESQMMQETEKIVHRDLNFLPLKLYKRHIIEGNALRMDWNEVVSSFKLNYIMGNPPFVGYALQSKEQKADILSVYVDKNGNPYKGAGKIDYVSGWYFKAAEYIQNTSIQVAFVSTNSITQGEQTANVWKPLYERFGIHIDFAYQTFRWDSEASSKAQVHCVIIGFSVAENKKMRQLFIGDEVQTVKNINAYLMPAENIFIESRNKPICDVPEMCRGFQPTENGYLILNDQEKDELLKKEPEAEKWIRPFSMGVEFINKIPRYCLWLVGITPTDLHQLPEVEKRVIACRNWRENAPKTGDAYKLRNMPHLFRPIKNYSEEPYIAVPVVSSENRRYIPIGYLGKDVIPGNKLFIIQRTSLYHFGVLTSNVHMAWMRAVCGRLKSDYSYSSTIVYNNFPWPDPTPEQKARIEQTAQAILNARALYPDSSLADMYGEKMYLYHELDMAHHKNDNAVLQAYGWGKDSVPYHDESACVAELMKLYQQKVGEQGE